MTLFVLNDGLTYRYEYEDRSSCANGIFHALEIQAMGAISHVSDLTMLRSKEEFEEAHSIEWGLYGREQGKSGADLAIYFGSWSDKLSALNILYGLTGDVEVQAEIDEIEDDQSRIEELATFLSTECGSYCCDNEEELEKIAQALFSRYEITDKSNE